MKFTDVFVTFKEVPDEISLTFNISNCPYKCKGCHSPELQTNIGTELTLEILSELLEKNPTVTCITFLGYGNNYDDLIPILQYCKEKDYKTCLYTGDESVAKVLTHLYPYIDYIKTGRYIKEFGGLDSENTNQVFTKVNYVNRIFNLPLLEDLTYKFKKHGIK